MEVKNFLAKFEAAAGQLNKALLHKKQIEVATGATLNFVYLKLFKRSWSNSFSNPLTAESRIVFSAWINGAAIKEEKIFYEIRALKLRKLKGYSIKSKEFANSFRNGFKKFEHKWANVNVQLGPLTLMKGWMKISGGNFQNEIPDLVNNFLEIVHLIDESLATFKS